MKARRFEFPNLTLTNKVVEYRWKQLPKHITQISLFYDGKPLPCESFFVESEYMEERSREITVRSNTQFSTVIPLHSKKLVVEVVGTPDTCNLDDIEVSVHG